MASSVTAILARRSMKMEGIVNGALDKVSLETSFDPVPGEATHFREHLIDMAGPGADLSPFAHTLNVVLRFRANLDRFPPGSAALTDGIVGSPDAIEYNRGVMQATLKVAARLGRVVERVEPDEVEAFALPPCDPALPRVLCVTQFLSHVPFLYGLRAAVRIGTALFAYYRLRPELQAHRDAVAHERANPIVEADSRSQVSDPIFGRAEFVDGRNIASQVRDDRDLWRGE